MSKFIFILFLFFPFLLIGQSINEISLKYSVKHYTTHDGLSNSYVLAILKDKNGALWVGTKDGLNRYDGERFYQYRNDAVNEKSISGNAIHDLFEDSKGRIWVATSENGVCYFDPKRNEFIQIPEIELNAAPQLAQNITENKKGEVYIITKNYLYKIKEHNNSLKTSKIITNNKVFCAINADVDGSILLKERNTENMYRLHRENLESWLTDLGFYTVFSILSTSDFVWICSSEGLKFIDRKSGNIHTVVLAIDQLAKGDPNIICTDILQDNNSLWIASYSGVFFLKDILLNPFENNSIQHIHENLPKGRDITIDYVNKLCKEENGIWAASAHHLNLIEKDEQVFRLMGPLSDQSNNLKGKAYTSILQNEFGTWTLSRRGGLQLTSEGRVTNIIPSSSPTLSERCQLIAQDNNNNLWLASNAGIFLLDLSNFNKENPSFTSIESILRIPKLFYNFEPEQLFLDHEGSMWIAGLSGLIKFSTNGSNKVPSHYEFIKDHNSSIPSNSLHTITQDQKGNYWLGSSIGLIEMTNKNKLSEATFQLFTHHKLKPTSIAANNILSIFIDQNETLWIGTDHGLSNFNPTTTQSTNYGIHNGLVNLVVNNIIQDLSGDIWVTTEKGLSKFNPATVRFENYGTKDGLPYEAFEIRSQQMDKDGRLYFGTHGGLVHFNPTDIPWLDVEQNLKLSQLYTTDQLNGQRIKVFPQKNTLTLKQNQFPFRIEFSPYDFRSVRNNEYYYQLNDGANNWIPLDDRTELEISSLAPGNYKIAIQGGNRGKLWKTKPLMLSIQSLPPWYSSWWAYIIYAMAILAIIYGIYKFQLSRKIAEQEATRLKELDAFKTKFFANITHEFRTPLTVIQGMANELEEHVDPVAYKNLELIKKNSHGLLSLVNQLLDISKLKAGKMDAKFQQDDILVYIKYIVESLESFARSKEIGLQFYSEDQHLVMDFDAEKIKQVLTNLISNALKYTPKFGKILVVAKRKEFNKRPTLQVVIKDNGIGIAKEDLPHIFNRFHQINTNHSSGGSGIGLAFVKELMNGMNAKIEVESIVDQGTSFMLNFLILNNAPLVSTKTQLTNPINQQNSIISISETQTKTVGERPILLIIEDNADVVFYLKSCLRQDYQLITCNNGKDGLATAFETLPDIIISDVMMPEMDGFEVCLKLKSDERTSHIPIILLTAKATTEDKLIGLTQGADAYLVKPFEKAELLIRLTKLLEVRTKLQEKYSKKLVSTQSNDFIQENKEDSFILKVEQLVMKNLSNENFSVQDLAAGLFLSRSQVHRKIKALTGMSTTIFIRHIRLHRAKELLLTTNQNVSEIAFQVGFKTAVYFSQAFKEVFGSSPTSMRK